MEEYRNSSGKRRVGLIGGTFDPVHYGHLVIAEEVCAVLTLDDMIFIPAGQPPHKPGRRITRAEDRLKMLELAIASNQAFSLSRIEIERVGVSYTVETLRTLRAEWGVEVMLYFVIGWDSLEELHTWYNPGGLLACLDYLVAVSRPGYQEEKGYRARLEGRLPGITERLLVVEAPQLEISSTDLRRRVTEGRPIKYQVPEVVEQYIIQHGLYQEQKAQ